MLASHSLCEDTAAFIDNLGSGGTDHPSAAHALGQLLSALSSAHFMVGADKVWAGYSTLAFLGF